MKTSSRHLVLLCSLLLLAPGCNAPTAPTPAAQTGVSIEFDDGVSELQRAYIQDSFSTAQHAFGDVGPFQVYAFADQDKLIAACKKDAARDCSFDWSTEIAFTMCDGIFINMKALQGEYSSPFSRLTVFHEYYHLVQRHLAQTKLGNINYPEWLIEGSAQYQAIRLADRVGAIPFGNFRYANVSMAQQANLRLPSLESEGGHLESYTLGFLAAELLACTYGEESLTNYWKNKPTRSDWTAVFKRTFGVYVVDFYEAFQHHRQSGYPDPCK